MPAYDGQYGSGRGSDAGSFSAVVPQDRNVSGRIRVFDLAAPDVGKRRPDAIAQEGSSGGLARGDDGDGGRRTQERAGRGRSEVGWVHRPDAVAAVGCGFASRVSDDFFAA